MAIIAIATGGIPLSMFQKIMREKPKGPEKQQISLLEQGHYGHNLDVTGRRTYCSDCEVYL